MKVTKETQRLLFLGKQLEDEDDEGTKFTLFDYNVKVRHLYLLYLLSFALIIQTKEIKYPENPSKICQISPPKPQAELFDHGLLVTGERSDPVVREKATLRENIPELARTNWAGRGQERREEGSQSRGP